MKKPRKNEDKNKKLKSRQKKTFGLKRNFIATNFYCAEQKSRISEKREKRNKEKRKENGYKGKIGKMKLSDNEPCIRRRQ